MAFFKGVLLFLVVLLASFLTLSFSEKIIVGDSNHWQFGFNYTDWSRKNAPFYQHDSLVFMYDPPNSTTPPHSVYLLKDLKSYLGCNLKGAKLVASVVQGGGQGLEFVLKKRKPHYFACGEHGGVHCNLGLMKFSVFPVRASCHG